MSEKRCKLLEGRELGWEQEERGPDCGFTRRGDQREKRGREVPRGSERRERGPWIPRKNGRAEGERREKEGF